jgi:hypothetical protein
MKFAALSLAFAFSSLSLAAQNAAPGGLSTYRIGPIGNGCPVSMKLEQTLSHQLQVVQNGKLVKSPATQLTLSLGPAFSSGFTVMEPVQGNKQPASPSKPAQAVRRVASATATVRGFGAGAEFELVSPAVGQNVRGKASNAPQKNLKLQFNAKNGISVALMWLPGFGAVRSLDLSSITYSDGFTWKPAGGQSCSVTPDPFMLIDADSVSVPAP